MATLNAKFIWRKFESDSKWIIIMELKIFYIGKITNHMVDSGRPGQRIALHLTFQHFSKLFHHLVQPPKQSQL